MGQFLGPGGPAELNQLTSLPCQHQILLSVPASSWPKLVSLKTFLTHEILDSSEVSADLCDAHKHICLFMKYWL